MNLTKIFLSNQNQASKSLSSSSSSQSEAAVVRFLKAEAILLVGSRGNFTLTAFTEVGGVGEGVGVVSRGDSPLILLVEISFHSLQEDQSVK